MVMIIEIFVDLQTVQFLNPKHCITTEPKQLRENEHLFLLAEPRRIRKCSDRPDKIC